MSLKIEGSYIQEQAMPFPTKEYYRLQNIQMRWGVSQEDIFYAVENGLLRACVWLPLRYVERGVIRNRKFIYETHEHREGFVGVRPEDCRRIFYTGRAKLRIFTSVCQEDHILRLAYEPPQPSICARINDLVILKKDRDKFEAVYEINALQDYDQHVKKSPFLASDDYRYVKLNEHEYHFGDVQARIVELLFDASQSNKPWVHGKTLIFESGSQASRVRDIFKHQSNWRNLIHSNDRGYYRLNTPSNELQNNPADGAIESQQHEKRHEKEVQHTS